MRLFVSLSCFALLACATAANVAAPGATRERQSAAAPVDGAIATASGPVTSVQPSASAPAEPPREKQIQVLVPNGHWKSEAAEALSPDVGHILKNARLDAIIEFTVGKGPAAEVIAGLRTQDLLRKKCQVSAVQRYSNSSILTYEVEQWSEFDEGVFMWHEMVGVYQVPGYAGGPAIPGLTGRTRIRCLITRWPRSSGSSYPT